MTKPLSISFIFLSTLLFGQNNLQDLRIYHDVYTPEAVLDNTYGITMYNKFNARLGGDSVRNCKGYACSDFVEDYYTTGQLLHKGYYLDGQVTSYKNWYPNGNLERNFRVIDANKSKETLYYSDGTKKSEITYMGDFAVEWQDYYPNGVLEYDEKYHPSNEFYLNKNSYYNNGQPQSTLELDNKKKLIYIKTEYYPDGKIKEQGEVLYNKAIFDYQKYGTWIYNDENGVLKKQETYTNGKVTKEKTF